MKFTGNYNSKMDKKLKCRMCRFILNDQNTAQTKQISQENLLFSSFFTSL